MFPTDNSSDLTNAKTGNVTSAAEAGAEPLSFGAWGAEGARKRLTARDVISVRFEDSGRRGESYLAVEVDDFLDEVAWTLNEYEKEIGDLRRRLS